MLANAQTDPLLDIKDLERRTDLMETLETTFICVFVIGFVGFIGAIIVLALLDDGTETYPAPTGPWLVGVSCSIIAGCLLLVPAMWFAYVKYDTWRHVLALRGARHSPRARV